MNIFDGLRVYALPNYPIFRYKGRDIWEAIFESWGASTHSDPYMFSERLRTIASIVKARALRYRFERREGKVLSFEELIFDLCQGKNDLAKETISVLNSAIHIDNKIGELRKKTNFIGKVNISDHDLDDIVAGPVYYGTYYDDFLATTINFQSEHINEIFTNEIILDFEDPIYFDEDSTNNEITDENMKALNEMHIFKSNTIDLLKLPKGGYFLCIDANRRFQDGELVVTDSAWLFRQKQNNLSVVIIK